ncbi:MAG: hypothetical protein ABSG32_02355 [Terriglobia bacterium]
MKRRLRARLDRTVGKAQAEHEGITRAEWARRQFVLVRSRTADPQCQPGWD